MMVRSFLAVGQGAFYCECFNGKYHNINVVYDCGSSTSMGVVESAITANFAEGEEIEALFISHMHTDHINGVPFLLKYCRVKKIYFPLIASENKKLLRIFNDLHGVDGFSREFPEDPRQAVRDLQIDYSPQLIQIKEVEHEERNELDLLQRESGDNVFDDMRSDNFIERDWLYIPFNFRQRDRIVKLYDNLAKQFERTIGEDELEQLWRGRIPADLEKIMKAYEKVPGGMNTNSMTLFSGPAGHESVQYLGMGCKSCWCDRHWPCFKSKLSGCLYTGDYGASGKMKWEQLSRAYEEHWKHIGCVQVPHHGSKHNFNESFLEMNAFFIVSAGYTNKYQHPHASVIKAFLLRNKMLYIVTEQAGSSVALCVE